jgi:hypothetical protein
MGSIHICGVRLARTVPRLQHEQFVAQETGPESSVCLTRVFIVVLTACISVSIAHGGRCLAQRATLVLCETELITLTPYSHQLRQVRT